MVLYSLQICDDRLVKQDNGVSMRAITSFRASEKDKNLKEVMTTYYGVVRDIIELDYVTFRQTVFYYDSVKLENKTNGCKVDPFWNLVMVNLS